MQSLRAKIVVLGTGGTIAGTAARHDDNVGYSAAQVGVAGLVAALPALAETALEAEQLAQLDSKDMDHATWLALARRVAHHLSRPDVAGLVVTHGTDTLEETAYFLHRVLAPAKPVVLTAAMRPSTAVSADGPANLLDAVRLAAWPEARGVMAVVAGTVHGGADVRKVHPYRVDAFSSGDAGPVGRMEEGRLVRHRDWPAGDALGVAVLPADASAWPWVELVTSYAGANGQGVRALVAAGVDGLAVAATGNGTLHRALEEALHAARREGVAVLRSSRCGNGRIVEPGDGGDALPSAGALTPVQARIELMLSLMRLGKGAASAG